MQIRSRIAPSVRALALITATLLGACAGQAGTFGAAVPPQPPAGGIGPDPSFELPMSASSLEWPTFAHDPMRTAFQPMNIGITQANVAKLRLHWVWKSHSIFYTSAIVVHGVVYAIDAKGTLTALNAATGAVLWQRQFAEYPAMTPAYDSGILFVATRFEYTKAPSVFYALDPSDGHIRWHQSIVGATHSSPVFVNGNVYVGTAFGDPPLCDPGAIHIFNEQTGAPGPTWLVEPGAQQDGGGVWGALSVTSDGKHILFGTGNTCANMPATANAIVSISPAAVGQWSINTANQISDDDVAGGVMLLGGNGFVMAKNGSFYDVNALTGALAWSKYLGAPDGGGGFATPTYSQSTIIISGGFASTNTPPGSVLYGLNLGGSVKWTIHTKEPVIGGWVASTKDLAFAELDNSIAALNPATGKKLWSYATQNYFDSQAAPVVTPEGIFVGDMSGNLYNFTIPAPGDRTVAPALPPVDPNLPVPRALARPPTFCKLPGGKAQ